MTTITIKTDLAQLPARLRSYASQVPYATSVALNQTAFGLMREEKAKLDDHLELRNQWTQRGVQVEKASKASLTAHVGNVRWYMETLVDGGTRRPVVGIHYKGDRYLLVPTGKGNGSIKGAASKPFVIDDWKGDVVLAYRTTRKRLPIKIIGRLMLETNYKRDTFPASKYATDYVIKHFEKNWISAMYSAASTAR